MAAATEAQILRRQNQQLADQVERLKKTVAELEAERDAARRWAILWKRAARRFYRQANDLRTVLFHRPRPAVAIQAAARA
jgi:hypothetical protein